MDEALGVVGLRSVLHQDGLVECQAVGQVAFEELDAQEEGPGVIAPRVEERQVALSFPGAEKEKITNRIKLSFL